MQQVLLLPRGIVLNGILILNHTLHYILAPIRVYLQKYITTE
jgi:hypothetical protein